MPYFHVVLFIMLYKMVLTFMFVDTTQVCDLSNESYCRAVLSCVTVYYAVQGGSDFQYVTIQMKEKLNAEFVISSH